MRPMRLQTIAALVNGQLHGADASVDSVSTDTRELHADDGRRVLFVALKGERFDAHAHLPQAKAAGAVAALVERVVDGTDLAQIVVDSPLAALATIARAQAAQHSAKVIAITGSNGKTSVKALTTAILQRAGRTYATPGNRNNEIGLPLAVLDTPADAQFAVYEMGTGAPGDIAYLTAIAPPHVALVNNVSPAHLERMGSLEAIADTKAAVYDDLQTDGMAIINADDAFAPLFMQRAGAHRLLRFGLSHDADITASSVQLGTDSSTFRLHTPLGDADITLAMAGVHNISNALAAASIALALGVELDIIADGLNSACAVAGRLLQQRLDNGALLVDDAYNANPASLKAAIAWLSAQSGRRWLVLGDMRELGAQAAQLHAECGQFARDAGLDRLYAIGALSAEAVRAFGEDAYRFDSHDALIAALRPALAEDVCVLVKGSRGSAMDIVVKALMQDEEHTHAA